MTKFKNVRIGDIGSIITGKTPKTNNRSYYGADYMFLGPVDLHKHFIINQSEKMISEKGLESIKGSILNQQSILIGCIGWDMGNVGFVTKKCATNQQINSITNIRNDINPYYVYYWLKTKKSFLYQQANVTRTPILNKTSFSNIEVNIPNKNYQDRVANILTTLDKKIALNNRINTELEAMAKTLYDYWFVQFDFPISEAQANALGKPELKGKPYKSSGGKMVFNEALKREIPEGWGDINLEDVVEIHDSKRIPLSKKEREKKQGSIPYYGATSVMGYVDDYIFDGVFVLLAEDGSVMNKKGNPVLQYIWGKSWVNNHAHVLKGKNGVSNEYLHIMLNNIPVILLMSGSIQKKINQSNLRKAQIISPDDVSLGCFQRIIKPVYEKRIVISEQNQQLTQLRDWLLPMLMNGQVTVK